MTPNFKGLGRLARKLDLKLKTRPIWAWLKIYLTPSYSTILIQSSKFRIFIECFPPFAISSSTVLLYFFMHNIKRYLYGSK